MWWLGGVGKQLVMGSMSDLGFAPGVYEVASVRDWNGKPLVEMLVAQRCDKQGTS